MVLLGHPRSRATLLAVLFATVLPETVHPRPEAAKPGVSKSIGGVPDSDADSDAPDTADEAQKKIASFKLPETTMLALGVRKNGRAFVPSPKLLAPYATGLAGDREAVSIVDGAHLVDAPVARAFAQEIVDRLMTAWDGPKPVIRVAIEASAGFAAHSDENGLMIIPLGAFNPDPHKGAATADELSLLLAHELGHFLLHHVEHQHVRKVIVHKLAMAGTAWVAYGSMSKSRVDDNGRITIVSDPATIQRALLSSMAVNMIIDDLLSSSFNRRSEIEADLIGIDLAKKAGYRITESQIDAFITRHQADQATKSDRIEMLKTIVQAAALQLGSKVGNQAATKAGVNIGGLGDILGGFGAKVIGAAFDQLSKTLIQHPDPTVRLGIMDRYYKKAYAAQEDAEQLQRADPRLAVIKSSPLAKTILPAVEKALSERLAMSQGAVVSAPVAPGQAPTSVAALPEASGPPSARAPARGRSPARGARGGRGARGKAPPPPPVIRGGTQAEALTWLVAGYLDSVRGGNAAAAQLSWQRGAERSYPSLDSAHAFGQAAAAADQRAQIAPVLDRLTKVLGTTDPVMDLVIGAAIARGDIASAEIAAAKCVHYRDGENYPRCVLQLGYDPTEEGVSATTPEGQKAFADKKGIFKQLNVLSILGKKL